VSILLFATVLALGCDGDSSPPPPQLPMIDPATRGMDVLGSGTDVFGAYAVEANVKARVLDVDALNAARLLVHSPDVQEYRYEEASGHTMSEYTSHLGASVGLAGSYKFFSAEVKSTFSQDSYRRDDYSYASIIERHWKHALRVAPGVWASGTHLRSYLTPLARQAIDDTDAVHGPWSGAQVIAAYGTHVMNGIYVGARLDYHLAVQIMSEQHRQAFMMYAKAKYDASFASAGIEFQLDNDTRTAMESYNKVGPVIDAKGGAVQYAHPENDADYQLWKQSLDANPVFCGIIDGGLLGIWELASTPERRQELLTAFEAYAAEQDASFIPMLQKITDIVVLDAGQGTNVTLPTGYKLLRSTSNDTVNGTMNRGRDGTLWYDLTPANNVYLGYRAVETAQPVGVAEVHVASTDAATNAYFFGASGHDAIYGTDNPGCTRNFGVDLNSGTCGSVQWSSEWFCYPFPSEIFHGTCVAAGTPLELHLVKEASGGQPIRCLVVGDDVAKDSNQPLPTRAAHIYWGPEDANRDGRVDAGDAEWVLNRVTWLTNRTDGALVNLNHGTQSYHRWSWVSCLWGGGGWDEGWCRPKDHEADAWYIGVCH
jgi:hypothetical protein